jgi:hypothetical protein
LFLYVRGDQLNKYAHVICASPLAIVHPGIFEGRIQPQPRLLLFALLRTTSAALGRRWNAVWRKRPS